jgi:hypothetical protein
MPVPPPEGSPQASFPGELPVGPFRVANPFESDWGFRRCGLVFAAPGPPTAVHLPSPPPLPPSPHALPMRFPGRVSGEGLEKPRPDRDGSPGWPGGWNAGGKPWGTPGFCPGESHGLTSSAFGGRIPGENPAWARGDPTGKPRRTRRETPWESPGGTEEDPAGKPPGAHGGMGVVAEPAAARRPGPGVSPVKHPRPAEGPGVLYVKHSPQPEFCGAIK